MPENYNQKLLLTHNLHKKINEKNCFYINSKQQNINYNMKQYLNIFNTIFLTYNLKKRTKDIKIWHNNYKIKRQLNNQKKIATEQIQKKLENFKFLLLYKKYKHLFFQKKQWYLNNFSSYEKKKKFNFHTTNFNTFFNKKLIDMFLLFPKRYNKKKKLNTKYVKKNI